MTAALNFILQV